LSFCGTRIKLRTLAPQGKRRKVIIANKRDNKMSYATCLYGTDDLIQISALQHMAFCPRQCALIYVEQVWEENALTAEGRLMHERGP
jgi:hypothetical protein